MAVEKAKIILKHPSKEVLFSYSEEGECKMFPPNCGIAGKVMQTGQFESVANAYNNPLFNGVVDIETSMPLLCTCIKHPNTGKIMGAIEVVNSKGIQGLAALQKVNVNPSDLEILEFFTNQLAQAALNCFEWEKLESSLKGENYHLDDGKKQ